MRLLIVVLSVFPAIALAQAGDATRGNTPPGMSQDGSRAADGAVKGGSIVPGESAGVPNKDSSTGATERLKRCGELNGSLREDCLSKERSAAGGSSAPRKNDPREGKSQTEMPYGAD
jgi:hypothetical protein